MIEVSLGKKQTCSPVIGGCGKDLPKHSKAFRLKKRFLRNVPQKGRTLYLCPDCYNKKEVDLKDDY